MSKKPLILITNDDGVTAPGIKTLIDVMLTLGDVVVVAPDSPQSGMGHAITVDNVLTCNPITIDEGPQLEYTCSGTPADCVKMAVNEILNRKPDFLKTLLWTPDEITVSETFLVFPLQVTSLPSGIVISPEFFIVLGSIIK